MGSGGIPDDWKPSPPPERGTPMWKNDIAFKQVTDFMNGLPRRNAVIKLVPYEGYDLGYFCVRWWPGHGHDYFRVDSVEDLRQEALR